MFRQRLRIARDMPQQSTFRICLFGCVPGTGNLGVDALFTSLLSGLVERLPQAEFTSFDFGRGRGEFVHEIGEREIRLTRHGANLSWRLWSKDSLRNIRLSNQFWGIGNSGARAIRSANAIFDVSAGDSFTDLYGPWRFKATLLPKQIAIEAGAPLHLTPQTYGPFRTTYAQKCAAAVTRQASSAWARDGRSFEALKELLGKHFDPARHHEGVDMAFALKPAKGRCGEFVDAIRATRDSKLLVGFNVSGLIYNQREASVSQYGLRANYAEAVTQFLKRLLCDTDADVILVPHVVPPPNQKYEADPLASQDLMAALGEPDRVSILPQPYTACEVKWAISKMDWFCGTRMHATIAGLSTGVPTAAISYSPKTLGVFETCGLGTEAIDPTLLDTQDMSDRLWEAFDRRDAVRKKLLITLPGIIERARRQMNQIVAISLGNLKTRDVIHV
jgi:colanic acid/amylovoran biosynthesis protein